MRIGFFGGSFDPPHLGHLAVARAAANAFTLDEILVAPTGRQPLKPNGPSASFQDRLAMVSLLCALQPRGTEPHFDTSTLDAPRADGSPNFTADTLHTLRSQLNPQDTIFVLIGADAFLGLPKWKSHQTLLNAADWIVVSRPGISLQLDDFHLSPQQLQRVHVLSHVHEPASATEIRALLRSGADCVDLLPSSILTYIRTHHLYGT